MWPFYQRNSCKYSDNPKSWLKAWLTMARVIIKPRPDSTDTAVDQWDPGNGSAQSGYALWKELVGPSEESGHCLRSALKVVWPIAYKQYKIHCINEKILVVQMCLDQLSTIKGLTAPHKPPGSNILCESVLPSFLHLDTRPSPGWPRTCSPPISAGIIGMYHHTGECLLLIIS